VVVAAHPGVGEAFRLVGLEETEGAGDLQARLLPHRRHGVDDLVEEPLARAPDRHHDAELGRPGVTGGPGGGEDLVEVQEGVDVDAGVEVGRLRAEGAVLGAGAGLGVDEALELDLRAAPGQAHPVGQGDQRRQLVEGELRHRQGLVPGEGAALVEQGAFGGGERHGDSFGTGSLGA
jgi:hypothetical protein